MTSASARKTKHQLCHGRLRTERAREQVLSQINAFSRTRWDPPARCGTQHLLKEVINVDHSIWRSPNGHIQALDIRNYSNALGWHAPDAWPSLHHWTIGQLASSVWASRCITVSESCCHTSIISRSLVARIYIYGAFDEQVKSAADTKSCITDLIHCSCV